MKFAQGFFGVGGDRLSTNVEDLRGIWDDTTFQLVLTHWVDEARKKMPPYDLFMPDANADLPRAALERAVYKVRDSVMREYMAMGPFAAQAKPVEARLTHRARSGRWRRSFAAQAKPVEARLVITADAALHVEFMNPETRTVFTVGIDTRARIMDIRRSIRGWHPESKK